MSPPRTGWAWYFGDQALTQPGTWMKMARWPRAGRGGHTSVQLPDGSIVLMGGYGGRYRNDVWRSTDQGATWTQLTPAAPWTSRYDHTSVALPDGSIVLMGGYVVNDFRNDVWQLQTVAATAQHPTHTYTEPGTYTVTLQAYNADGFSSMRRVAYIRVTSEGHAHSLYLPLFWRNFPLISMHPPTFRSR